MIAQQSPAVLYLAYVAVFIGALLAFEGIRQLLTGGEDVARLRNRRMRMMAKGASPGDVLNLLRDDPAMAKVVTAAGLKEHPEGRVTVAGLVLVRQRPGTASGVIFATIEDETGVSNLIIWPRTFETFRREVLASSLMRVEGKLQREGLVMHVIADRIDDLSHLLRDLGSRDGKLQLQVGRGDQVRHGGGGRPDAGRVTPTRYIGNRDETFPSRDFR